MVSHGTSIRFPTKMVSVQHSAAHHSS